MAHRKREDGLLIEDIKELAKLINDTDFGGDIMVISSKSDVNDFSDFFKSLDYKKFSIDFTETDDIDENYSLQKKYGLVIIFADDKNAERVGKNIVLADCSIIFVLKEFLASNSILFNPFATFITADKTQCMFRLLEFYPFNTLTYLDNILFERDIVFFPQEKDLKNDIFQRLYEYYHIIKDNSHIENCFSLIRNSIRQYTQNFNEFYVLYFLQVINRYAMCFFAKFNENMCQCKNLSINDDFSLQKYIISELRNEIYLQVSKNYIISQQILDKIKPDKIKYFYQCYRELDKVKIYNILKLISSDAEDNTFLKLLFKWNMFDE